MEALTPLHDPLSGVVVVLLADFLRQHQGWGWLRLVAGATPYKDVPGLTMAKVMGSGHAGHADRRCAGGRSGACPRAWNGRHALGDTRRITRIQVSRGGFR